MFRAFVHNAVNAALEMISFQLHVI